MANLLGDGFSNYVRKQINNRQKVHGKQNRSNKEIAYLNSRTAWIKVVSGVSVDNSRLKMLGLQGSIPEGLDLAKKFVLFNGTSEVKTNKNGSDGKIIQREGIYKGSLSTKNQQINNFAYGLGGLEFGMSPMPGIVDLDVNHAGTRGSLRKASVTIKAYNRQQLDIIDVLYLRLGFTLLIEWGHNQYINNQGKIVNLDSTLLEEKFFNSSLNKSTYLELLPLIEKKRFETGGNYDALFGRITNFKWSFENDGTYSIRMDLYSLGDLAESLTISHPGSGTNNDLSGEGTTNPGYTNNVINDYLEDIRNYHKYRFTPDAEADGTESPVTPPADDTVEEDEVVVEEVVEKAQKVAFVENQLINDEDFKKALEESNHIVQDIYNKTLEERIIIDEIGQETYYIKYADVWFLKKNIVELLNNVEIVKDDNIGAYVANPIKEGTEAFDKNQQIRNAADGSIIANDVSYQLLLGGNQNQVIIDYDAQQAGYEDFNSAKLDALYNTVIIDDTQGGIAASVKMTDGGVIFKSDLIEIDKAENIEELEEASTQKAIIPNNAKATAVAQYELNRKLQDIQKKLEDSIGLKDIFYTIGKGVFDPNELSFDFGRVLNFQDNWKEKQPNGRYLYPQNSASPDVVKLDYKYDINPFFDGFYIRFGTFLDYIREHVLYKIGDDKNTKEKHDIPNTPIIDIDTDELSNVMYTLPNQISLNQSVCVVNNSFTFKDLHVETFIGLKPFQNITPYYGKVMNIYLNFSFLQDIMSSCTSNDNTNTVYLYDALLSICAAVNEALGGINNLEPIIDEKTNCLKIIDSSRLPNIKEITNFLHSQDPIKYNYPTDIGSFNYNKFTLADGSIKYDLNLFGYDVKDNSSNFIHNIDLSTSVTKNMSTMLAIGAASQGGYVIGEEATMFSKWNEGIHDRFNEPILNADGTVANSTSSFYENWDNARIGYGNLIIDNFFKVNSNYAQGDYYPYWGMTVFPNSDVVADFPVVGILNNELIQRNLRAGTEFYKMLITSSSIANNISLSGQPGFLPLNLQIAMDGLSGIKIYEKVNVDTSFLPTNYPQTLDFLSTGLKHFLKDNKWETTLTTQATTIGTFKGDKPLPELFSIESALKDIDLEYTSITGELDESGYDDVVIGCPPSNPQKLPFVLNNQQKADTELYLKAQTLLSNIFNSCKDVGKSKGLCARYVKNIAKKFWEEWKKGDKSDYTSARKSKSWNAVGGLFRSPKYGVQDAKSKLTHDNLVSNFGYKMYRIGQGIHKKNLNGDGIRDIITSINLFPGDIIIYWDTSNTDNRERGYQLYGHIQMYLGTIGSTVQTQGGQYKQWMSDFLHSNFVYGGWSKKYNRPSSHPDTCWNIILLKSPLNPLKAVPKPPPDPVVTNIGERASSNVFSPINKL